MDLLIIFIISLAATMKLTIWLLDIGGVSNKEMEEFERRWGKQEWYSKEERENSLF